jgi:hypothetical protein
LLSLWSAEQASCLFATAAGGEEGKIMRKLSVAAMAVGFVLVLNGCGGAPTHDSVARDSINAMKDFTTALGEIKDEASAKTTAPKLKKIAERMKTIEAQQKALPKMSEAEEKALKAKYEKEATELFGKLFAEGMRVAMIPGANAVMEDAMKDMPKESILK